MHKCIFLSMVFLFLHLFVFILLAADDDDSKRIEIYIPNINNYIIKDIYVVEIFIALIKGFLGMT